MNYRVGLLVVGALMVAAGVGSGHVVAGVLIGMLAAIAALAWPRRYLPPK